MPKYEAEFEIPWVNGDSEAFIEALRGQAHPKLVLRIEAKDRKEAVAELAEATNPWWPEYDEYWWQSQLVAIRGNRAKEDI